MEVPSATSGDVAARMLGFRSCLARFATGVSVAGLETETGPAGITVNSFTSVSLEPPLVLVAIRKQARLHDRFPGRPFSVNVLRAEQERLALHFAGGAPAQPVWQQGRAAPRLAGSLAHIECAPWAAYDGGDHTLYVGEVVDFDYDRGDGLGYFCGRFVRLEEPSYGIEFLF